MTTLLFIFALLTTPTDRWVCDLWTAVITRDGVIQACGVDLLSGLRVDIYNHEDMSHVCSVDAVYLNDLAELAEICQLRKTLDHYVLRIVQPGYTTLICYVETPNESGPSSEEIAAQCPNAGKKHIIEFAGTREDKPEETWQCPPREIAPGFGLYSQPLSVTGLLTSEPYTWLAGQLIWAGVVKAKCADGGVNSLTMIATPCGMAAARQAVNEWQNQFNADIFAAAHTYQVPALLLKRIMARESQFWPFYAAEDEYGIMQITDNGLDVLMRFDGADLDPYYFERGETGRLWSRGATRDALACHGCSLTEATAKIKQDMSIYARVLAAYHCRAVTINPALEGDDAWRQTVIDYNGSIEYLEKIEQ